MICTKWVCALLAAIALVLVSGWTAAEAQLAKSGSYTVYYAWHGKGERITAEKGQFVLGGTSAHGVLINKTGEGFLHQVPTDCAAGFKSVRGVAEVTGYCGSVDKDGDRIFMKWVCSNNAEGWCVGEFDWIDGTGKYQGISGKNTLRYKTFGSRTGADTTHGTPFENEGYGIWEGSWRLP